MEINGEAAWVRASGGGDGGCSRFNLLGRLVVDNMGPLGRKAGRGVAVRGSGSHAPYDLHGTAAHAYHRRGTNCPRTGSDASGLFKEVAYAYLFRMLTCCTQSVLPCDGRRE